MLLSIFYSKEYIGQSSIVKNFLAPNIHSADVEKPLCAHVEGIPWANPWTKFVTSSAQSVWKTWMIIWIFFWNL